MTLTKYFKYIFPIFAVVIASVVGLFFKSFRTSETPRHWLAELQYSHIAITENLQSGEGSVFRPKSYNLDPKGGGENQTYDGLTEARFPILNYVVSILSTNRTSQITIWRTFSFVFYLLAVAISVLLMYELCKNWVLSLLVSLGANFTSVVLFAQHAVGTYMFTYFLILASVYLIALYHNRDESWMLFLGLVLSGIAMLQGHGSIIFFTCILGQYLFRFLKHKENQKALVTVIGLGFIFLGLFFYQRVILYSQNGGLFELNGIFQGGIKGFMKANSIYLFVNSYGVSNAFLSFAVFLGIMSFLYVRFVKKGTSLNIGKTGVFILITGVLNLIYYICYVTSLVDYDFYALEAMTPVLVILSMYSISFVYLKLELKEIYFFGGVLSVLFISVCSMFIGYQERFVETEENRVQKSLDNLVQGDVFLDSLGIAKEEKISFINGYGNNISLMKTKRLGYVSNGVARQDFKQVLEHEDSKYILSQDQFFMYDVVNAYPEILNKLKLVATNETLSLYRKRDLTDSISGEILKDYVECHNFKDYHEFYNGFEKNEPLPIYGEWKVQGDTLTDRGYRSNTCLEINDKQEFPCTFELKLNEFEKKPTGVVITGMFYSEHELRKVCFNLSCHGKEGQYYNEIFKVSKKFKGDALNKWIRVSCKVTLPKVDEMSKDDIVKVFLWNPHKGKLMMDDFAFIFY